MLKLYQNKCMTCKSYKYKFFLGRYITIRILTVDISDHFLIFLICKGTNTDFFNKNVFVAWGVISSECVDEFKHLLSEVN